MEEPGRKINPATNKRLEAFDLEGVILKEGFLADQLKQVKDFFLHIPDNNLLHGFRKRIGRKASGKSLGGWYGMGRFNNFGQLLSAYARMYKVSKDKRILEKLNFLMNEWGECITPDNYFFYSEKVDTPHYEYDKMVGGLVDIYQYTGNKDSLKLLGRITIWAERNLDVANEYAHDDYFGSTEWYTLPENLYRAYLATGDNKYKKLGDGFLYHDYYKHYANNDFTKLMEAAKRSKYGRYHAYSHVNTLNSAAMAYYITNNDYYLEVLRNSFEILERTQLFNTGGYGPGETFMLPGQRTEVLFSDSAHFETPCGCWAAFKLAKYLIEFTGDSIYGNWIERLIYNGLGAALPIKNNGEVMYFSDYNIKGASKTTTNPWSCCVGTYPLGVTEYHNLIYFKDADGIYINLFISSETSFNIREEEIILEQKTDYPQNGKINIDISMKESVNFNISIRSPGWCNKKIEVLVNNEDQNIINQCNWIVIKRDWKNNDRISIDFPTSLRFEKLEEENVCPKVLTFGPVVLVTTDYKESLYNRTGLSYVEKNLNPGYQPQKDLNFRIKLSDKENTVFKPFYKIDENEEYYMYFDDCLTKRVDHSQLFYGPDGSYWSEIDLGHPVISSDKGFYFLDNPANISKKPGAYFEYCFTGKGIRWIGNFLEDGGISEIFINGKLIGTADQYGNIAGAPWMWEYRDLDNNKQYRLKVIGSERKHPDSNGYSINVKHISIL